MVDANWPRQGEPDFSGWLDQLDDEEGTFEQRWLRLSEGCLRIFRRAPVGVLPPACGPAGEAATIYEGVGRRTRGTPLYGSAPLALVDCCLQHDRHAAAYRLLDTLDGWS